MYQRILVPFDGSKPSVLGLAEALKLAKLTGAKLRVVYVISELRGATGFEAYGICTGDLLTCMRTTGAGILEQAHAQAKSADAVIETEVLESLGAHLVDRIVEQVQSWHADLVVIGSHGQRGAPRLYMGGDAEQILRLSPVPVLIVRRTDIQQDH